MTLTTRPTCRAAKNADDGTRISLTAQEFVADLQKTDRQPEQSH